MENNMTGDIIMAGAFIKTGFRLYPDAPEEKQVKMIVKVVIQPDIISNEHLEELYKIAVKAGHHILFEESDITEEEKTK